MNKYNEQIRAKLKKIHEKKKKEEQAKLFKELKEEARKIISSNDLSIITMRITNLEDSGDRNRLNTLIKEIKKNINQLIVEDNDDEIRRIITKFDDMISKLKTNLDNIKDNINIKNNKSQDLNKAIQTHYRNTKL